MKRSRACDNLVALETSAHSYSTDAVNDSLALEGPYHRLKRSRAVADKSNTRHDFGFNDITQDQRALQFFLELTDHQCVQPKRTSNLSALSRSQASEFESVPLKRNSRESMLLQKKKQRLAEVTNSFNEFNIHDGEIDKLTSTMHHRSPLIAKPQPFMMTETPETRILRGLCFPRESRCIDPLNKRQAQPFDVSAIMLSISPKR
ncbi:uncharacterized protein PHALS_04716 [Plasmopara halstedii]|uniref:Uncharacterized protein n=1 Tax=Plasmopara halstedii TaxID=4781 RepID=A0A0P1AAU4_PLAHL|nr:uncharacterized protein PHALS_04716 [Plasmopara halstedii]CEG37277.1 hypothetical protein PHALS_04716 [Plasmopara halstedii]|eukprot:XP_024573646.1 hypothetical protein PHALS_04716 [Plasmopara halstedii]